MDERDLEPEEALARGRVDQVGACVRKLGERRAQVADLVGDVVHARAALREEAADRRVLAERLEQLDPSVADANGCRPDALVVNGGPVLDLGAEELLVRRERSVEVAHGHAEMMDPPRFHECEANSKDS